MRHDSAPWQPALAADGSMPVALSSAAQAPAAHTDPGCPAVRDAYLYQGHTTASYFWDDGSGRNGDTGTPASGAPMQQGLVASPSWPMGTKGYVIHDGRKAPFFVGDRGPGIPSSSGVMIDLDGKTFAQLTGGTWDSRSLTVKGAGGAGHIRVEYVITQWGSGPGKKGAPEPFARGAYGIAHSVSPCPVPAPSASMAQMTAAKAGAGGAKPASPARRLSSSVVSSGSASSSGATVAAVGLAAHNGTAANALGHAATAAHFRPVAGALVAQELSVPIVSAVVVGCAVAACAVKAVLRRRHRQETRPDLPQAALSGSWEDLP